MVQTGKWMFDLVIQMQVWLCDTESAIGNGKNVSGLQNTMKLQLGKEVLQEVLSVKEQLNTVTVHLHPLNCFANGYLALGGWWKRILNIKHRKQLAIIYDYCIRLRRFACKIWKKKHFRESVTY
ncbi:putative peroxisomal acyl-coenzyme A oxidase 1.2 [Trichinella spiralis]|uniref:Peroxisomal acyl-coenzyme A oxidase 1.2 n=1 Tax=Trichinella spiralis TaxID=6334 RepID=A0ABR3KND6_TRISP